MAFTDDFSLHQDGRRDILRESRDAAAQVEAALEASGESAQGRVHVLAAVQRVEGARPRGLEVAKDGVEAPDVGQGTRLQGANGPGDVDTSGAGEVCDASETLGAEEGLAPQPGVGFSDEMPWRGRGLQWLDAEESQAFGDRDAVPCRAVPCRAVPRRGRVAGDRGFPAVGMVQITGSAARGVS